MRYLMLVGLMVALTACSSAAGTSPVRQTGPAACTSVVADGQVCLKLNEGVNLTLPFGGSGSVICTDQGLSFSEGNIDDPFRTPDNPWSAWIAATTDDKQQCWIRLLAPGAAFDI